MKQLFIKQKVFKITDHYPITDSNGSVHYYVDQDFRFIGHTVHVTRADGSPVFTVDREIFRLLPRYQVHFADGNSIRLQSHFSFLFRRISIAPESANLRLEGDFFDYNFQVYQGNNSIGNIRKVWLTWGDTYELTIYDERFEELFIAVVIAVDRLKDEAESNN